MVFWRYNTKLVSWRSQTQKSFEIPIKFSSFSVTGFDCFKKATASKKEFFFLTSNFNVEHEKMMLHMKTQTNFLCRRHVVVEWIHSDLGLSLILLQIEKEWSKVTWNWMWNQKHKDQHGDKSNSISTETWHCHVLVNPKKGFEGVLTLSKKKERKSNLPINVNCRLFFPNQKFHGLFLCLKFGSHTQIRLAIEHQWKAADCLLLNNWKSVTQFHTDFEKPGKMHSDFHLDSPFTFGAPIIAHLSQLQARFKCNLWRHVTSCDVITWPKKTNWNADLNWSWKIIRSENKKQIVDKNCLQQDNQHIFLSLSIKISKKWHPNRSQNETNWNPNRNRSNAQFDIE